MDTNWKHQKDAITTDQKFRVDDEHIHEIEKRHLKESEKEAALIPRKAEKAAKPEGEGEREGEDD
jgi:hypothetical protein